KSSSPNNGSDDIVSYQLCFNRANMAPGVPLSGNHPLCGSGATSADPRLVSFLDRRGEPVKLQVLPRSAFAIFQYLGRIVAAGEAGRIILRSPDAVDHPPFHDDVLFAVYEGGSGRCFLTIDYESRHYCVPEDGAYNTKRILGLISQLIALNTSITDIALTPEVRVVQ